MKRRSSNEGIYQGIIVLILVLFSLFFIISHNNFKDIVAVTDEQSKMLQVQRDKYETIIKDIDKKEEVTPTPEEKPEEKTYMEVEIPVYEYTKEEVYLLAQCVEAEAGVNNLESQKYVTQVILNRVHSTQFPDTIKEVIYQKSGKSSQFSVAYNGAMEREVKPQTLVTVYSVIVHGTDLPDYVLFFYADYLEEDNWVKNLNTYLECEGTVFAYK